MGKSYKFETLAIVSEEELLTLFQNKNIEVSSIVDLGDVEINTSNYLPKSLEILNSKDPKVLIPDVNKVRDLSFISYLDNLNYPLF